MKSFRRQLDLQAKISLILVAVIVPTFVIVTVAENQFTRPAIEEEILQVGITTGKNLASDIVSSRLLGLANPTPLIESRIQELLYAQPNITRVDVIGKDATGKQKIIATSVDEEDPTLLQVPLSIVDAVTSDYKVDETGSSSWEILVPIEQRGRDPHAVRKVLGTVHVTISNKLVGRIVDALWKTTASAAGLSVVALILVLSYLLRKTISNDRLLRLAETQNLQLTEQLHETQRQLMNTEKLAVMGQLTASFAHEIGTPLTAIGGHLQLLKEEMPHERLEIIDGQVSKIGEIVKSFLQSTAKPASQRQLVDLNSIVDKTIGIVRPRVDSLGVEVRKHFDRGMGPLRVVPLEMEQIFLNLINNSLDSINTKVSEQKQASVGKGERRALEVASAVTHSDGKQWAEVSVYDTGEGIKKADLKNVLKPFFTTKRPGEGTGLGLTICQQIAHKYGGMLEIDSKEGAWTKVTLKIPYQVNA